MNTSEGSIAFADGLCSRRFEVCERATSSSINHSSAVTQDPKAQEGPPYIAPSSGTWELVLGQLLERSKQFLVEAVEESL